MGVGRAGVEIDYKWQHCLLVAENKSPNDNSPFPNFPKPLFQSEAKCEAIDVKWFFILLQINSIFPGKILPVALKGRVGNGLFVKQGKRN